ncbi:F-box domain-containing protein [Entamoeba marina]
MSKLNPEYFVTIIKYIYSVDDLGIFNQVSKNCQRAFDETKINPLCGVASLGLALTLGGARLQLIEQKAFPHLETYQVHFREIEKLPLDSLKDYKYFEIYQYLMKDNANDYKNILAIRDRISFIRIDTNFGANLNLETMPNLQKLLLRISFAPKQNILDDAFAAIRNNTSLKKCVIYFRSSQIQLIIDNCYPHVNRIDFVFIINWLDDNDADKVLEFAEKFKDHPIGISDIQLGKFHYMFMRREQIVFIPHIRTYFRVSKEIFNDPHYEELKSWYLPIKEEMI